MSRERGYLCIADFRPPRGKRRAKKRVHDISVVPHPAHKQRVLGRDDVIAPRQEVVFVAHRGGHFVDGADSSAQRGGGKRIKRQDRRDCRINSHVHSVHDSVVGVGIGNQRDIVCAQRLPQFLVINEGKTALCPLLDRPAEGCLQTDSGGTRGTGGAVEEVARVKVAVTQKFIRGPMERVGAGLADGAFTTAPLPPNWAL